MSHPKKWTRSRLLKEFFSLGDMVFPQQGDKNSKQDDSAVLACKRTRI